MISTPEIASEHRPRKNLRVMARVVAWTIAVVIAAAGSAQGITQYSGAAVALDGRINGWGVTDAYYSGMYHTAYASTTLTSPKGRTTSSGWRNAANWVRADAYLIWDGTDLGSYLARSSHKFYCPVVRLMYTLPRSSGSGTAPSVILSLRTGNDKKVSNDNSRRGNYISEVGTELLGPIYSIDPFGGRLWVTGVEIVGTVSPSIFAGTIIFNRKIVDSRFYQNSSEETQYRVTNQMEPVEPAMQDQIPGPNVQGVTVVYDLDAPGVGNALSAPAGTIRRKRTNYAEWAVLSNGTKVSTDFKWYSVLSVIVDENGVGERLLEQPGIITGDNKAAVGVTKTTWDLK